jgi:hypothetical protein
MPKYNVSIEIEYRSYHEDEIEAEDETEAVDIAESRFYNDEYHDELRMNMETHDEHYDASLIIKKLKCPVCKQVYYEDNPDGDPIGVGYEPVGEYYTKGYTIDTHGREKEDE